MIDLFDLCIISKSHLKETLSVFGACWMYLTFFNCTQMLMFGSIITWRRLHTVCCLQMYLTCMLIILAYLKETVQQINAKWRYLTCGNFDCLQKTLEGDFICCILFRFLCEYVIVLILLNVLILWMMTRTITSWTLEGDFIDSWFNSLNVTLSEI